MSNEYEAFLGEFTSDGRSSDDDISAVEEECRISLPSDYRTFLLSHGGGEGFIGKQYLILWNANQIVRYNADYEVETYAPGLLLIGSSGGGEGFAFNLNRGCTDIVAVPFVGMSLKHAKTIAHSFIDFLDKLSHTNAELF